MDLRDRLIAVGQDPPENLNSSAKALRTTVRQLGLSGMQPSLDGSVLLLAAAFEQFVSDLIIAFVSDLPNRILAYNDLPRSIQSANERLTGEALSQRRSGFSISDRQRFVHNLRNCQTGTVPYVLNGEALALNNRNLNSGTLTELLRRLGVRDIWQDVGRTRVLQRWSGPGGAALARSRATTTLNDLIENRNKIAHRVGVATLGPDIIRSYLRFERALSRSLVKALNNYADSL